MVQLFRRPNEMHHALQNERYDGMSDRSAPPELSQRPAVHDDINPNGAAPTGPLPTPPRACHQRHVHATRSLGHTCACMRTQAARTCARRAVGIIEHFGDRRRRGRARFFFIARSMPTANTEDPYRSEGTERRISPRDLSGATLRFDLVLGVRRRHAPQSC